MRLHDFHLSGNAYKVRLFLGLIAQPYQRIAIDLPAGEHHQPAFLQLNPRGQVPVLEDDGVNLIDSQAILVYLARRYAPEHWNPQDALSQGRIAGWLSYAANEVHHGPGLARVGCKFGRPVDVAAAQELARRVLRLVDEHLAKRHWLCSDDAPTIADIAIYPYLALAEEGGVPLASYAHLAAWFARLRTLPGYVELPA